MLFIYIANKTGRNKWFGLEYFFKEQDVSGFKCLFQFKLDKSCLNRNKFEREAQDELMARPYIAKNTTQKISTFLYF